MSLKIGDLVVVFIMRRGMLGWEVQIANYEDRFGLLLPSDHTKSFNHHRQVGFKLLARILRIDEKFMDLVEIN